MATWSKQITVYQDDLYEDHDTGLVGTASQFFRCGLSGTHDFKGGVRFATVNVPKNAVITTAYLKLQVNQNSTTTNFTGKVWGDDVDDAPAWSAGSRPSQITKTTASANFPPGASFPAAGVDFTVGVTAIVQGIVNRPGWTSGADMRFMFERTGGAGGFNVIFIDALGTYTTGGGPTPPILKIIYTPAATGTPTVFNKISLTLGGGAKTIGDGTVRKRTINIPSAELATPFWVIPDGDTTRAQRVDSLPADIVTVAGTLAASSSEP